MPSEHPPDETPYERLRSRYEEQKTPWDQADPPPEVIDLIKILPAGRALDLGCGFGRASLYMAGRGWQVDGVDFIEIPIAEARRRAKEAGLAVNFHVGTITDLSFLSPSPPFDMALDVGCGHSLTGEEWASYYHELVRLLRPGGIFLIYGRLREDEWGLEEVPLLALLGGSFTLDKVERGTTHMADGRIFPSAWFWFRKNE